MHPAPPPALPTVPGLRWEFLTLSVAWFGGWTVLSWLALCFKRQHTR